MIYALLGLFIGVVIGFILPYTYNSVYSLYVSVAILASLDSLFGGIRANLENKFDIGMFLTGFFGNAIIAAFLAFIGEKLGVPLYYAAVITFGGRMFDNFAAMRRIWLNKRKTNN